MAKTFRVLKTDSGIKFSTGCSSCDRGRVLPKGDDVIFFRLASDWMEPKQFNTYVRGLIDENNKEKDREAKKIRKAQVDDLRTERNKLTRGKFLNMKINQTYITDQKTFGILLEMWQEQKESSPDIYSVNGHKDDSIIVGTKYPNGSTDHGLMIESIPSDDIEHNSRVKQYEPVKSANKIDISRFASAKN